MPRATREQLIERFKLWNVYTSSDPDRTLFEGSKTACFRYIRENHSMRDLKRGRIRIALIICEM
jgi:hypothetical protein